MSKRNSRAGMPALCPCDSGKPYANCCKPLHDGAPAPSAESLMRSRYAAFVLELPEYIHRSWHPTTRPAATEADSSTQWIGLRIERSELLDENRATVEFTARYKINGRAFALHETSRFVREEGHWFYVDGDIHDR